MNVKYWIEEKEQETAMAVYERNKHGNKHIGIGLRG